MTDLEIIKRIRAGNTRAYVDLIERYENKIYIAICRCITDEDKAMKLTEEIFVQTYLQLGNTIKEADYITYLFRVAVSQLRPACVTDENKRVLEFYERIHGLDSPEREIMLLRGIYELTYEQIAQKLSIDVDAVISHIANARETLAGQHGCDKYRLKLQAYLDNELMRVERMEVEAHLEECDCCIKIYEQMEMLLPGNFFIEMPDSVAQTAVLRIQEEVDDENDAFAPETKREQMAKKLEKNKNLYTWIIVLSVLLFGVFSWLFSLISENRLAALSSSDLQSGESSVIADSGEFSQTLAQSLQKADAVFVQFGISRVGVTEKPMILMFADYIATQPSAEYQGTVADSLGTITMEPASAYTITITASHRLLVDDGQTIWEIQTTRNELLDVLHVLGV